MRKSCFFFLSIFLFAQPISAGAAEIGSLPSRHISLHADDSGESYANFELHVGNRVIEFPEWTSIHLPDAKPALHSIDVEGDGIDEVVVLLPKKYGKGLYVNEPKVLKIGGNEDHLAQEIFLQDVRSVLLHNVKYYKKDRDFYVQLNDKDVLKLKNEGEPPKISVDSFVVYEVKGDDLLAKLLLQNANGEELGVFQVSYELKHTAMEPATLSFQKQ